MRAKWLLFVGSALVATACSPEKRTSPTILLERYWPAFHASLYRPRLANDAGVDRAIEPFAAEFPRHLGQGVRFSDASGDRWVVNEPNCGELDEPIGASLAYSCSWGSSIWRTSGAGLEEWLLVPGGLEAGDAPFHWQVEGGRLVQHGRSIDIYDVAGTARVSISAPLALDSLGRAIGVRLVAHDPWFELELDEPVAGPLLVDPAWIPAGTMAGPRSTHTATLLKDGRVLAAGGQDDVAPLLTAELWDPATHTWSSAKPMGGAHYQHAAVVLFGGDVLVAGGQKTTERYDPAADVWTYAGSMKGPHWDPASVVLPDGRVVVAGGDLDNLTEIYDPLANTWSLGAKAPGLAQFNAVMLPNGLALFAPMSGKGGLYNYKTDSWLLTLPLNAGHDYVPLVPLPSGRFLLAGGDGGSQSLNGVEVYDTATNAWLSVAPLGTKRCMYKAAVLPDGTVVAAGGREGDFMYLTSTEIYDEKADKWTAGPSMAVKRSQYALANLGGSKLLAVGGWNSGAGALASSELFAPGNGNGVACNNASQCASGFCADGVCCDSKCAGGQCVVCTKAKGATADGTCTMASFVACDDGDKCTLIDYCLAGVCKSGKPLTCKALDDCHDAGSCDSKTGKCSVPTKVDGAPCSDGDLCTQKDACASGACVGSDLVKCPAASTCFNTGSCIPQTGKCSPPTQQPEGTPCDDKNACTLDDVCAANGGCGSPKLVACPAEDECHLTGKCDEATGACKPVIRPNGSACQDGDACSLNDSCQQGKCVGEVSKSCPPPAECHLAGVCTMATGDCFYEIATEGTPCAGGTCQFGKCAASASAGSGSGTGGASGVSVSAGSGDPTGGEAAEVNVDGRGGCACSVGRTRDARLGSILACGLALVVACRRRRAA